MSPRSNPSRRAFLAGAPTSGVAVLAGCSSVIGALSDDDVYARTLQREIPNVSPAVRTTGSQFGELAAEITDYAEDALDRWDRISDRESVIRYDRSGLENALEFAETLPTAPTSVRTVEAAGAHLSNAASGYAYTSIETGDFDRKPTTEAIEGLEDGDAVHEAFTYDTDDPQTFLAYGRFVEYSLHQAELTLSKAVDAEDDAENATHATDVAERYGKIRQGCARVLDAEAYREALRNRDPSGDPFDETLGGSCERFDERGGQLLEKYDAWSDRLDELDEGTERRNVHSALYSQTNDSPFRQGKRYADDGYEVYGTVEMARGWLSLVAANTERTRIEEAGADTIDVDRIDDAKRDALDRLEDVLAGDPTPLERLFADDTCQFINAGDWNLEDESDDDESWQWIQANAYACYLLARGMLEHLDEAVDLLVGRQ